jgi:signal transduction histidine kinase
VGRRFPGSNQDVLLAGGLAVMALVEVLTLHDGYDRLVFVPIAVLVPLSLAWRRHRPLEVLALNIAAWVVIDLNSPQNEDPLALAIVLAVAVYSVGAHTSGRAAVVGAGLVASIAGLGVLADSDEGTLMDVLGNAVFFVGIFGGVWLAGRAMRRRRARERDLIVERDEGARAAVAEERSRIARELHDVVAHAISVILLQSRGARHARNADELGSSLDAIEETAGSALAEMRRLLGILRQDDEELALAPQPSIAGLDSLVAQVRDAGLPVEVVVEGEERPLPPGVDLSAYRIVQEALTNALKHAGPARALVRIRYGDAALDVEVADDGAGSDNGDGGGHGLVGMRERVSVFGGELRSGPRAGGGYAVHARLPL